MHGRRRGGIYVRLSREGEGTKLTDQITMCERLADANDVEVVKVYDADNGVSAFTGAHRNGWSEMLTDLQAGRLDIILAQSEDRFTRQVGEKETLTVLCADRGVVWLTVNDGLVDPRTADGEFFSILRGGLARMESRRKSERTLQRNTERRLRGEVPRGGVRPFGYGVVVGTRTIRRRSNLTSEYESVDVETWDISKLHPDEAPMVAAAYQFLLEQDADDSTGLFTIKRMFNASGVTTVNGNVWDCPKIEKVLRRGRNAGFVEHAPKDPETGRREVWASKVLDADGNPIRGAWETIVDEATYEASMARLTDPRRALKQPREARHLMSSIAKCVCGVPLRPGGRGIASETAYRCGVHQDSAPKPVGIAHVSIRCAELDAFVAREVARALMLAPRSAIPDPDADSLAALHVALSDTNKARNNLLELVEDSGFEVAQIKAKSLMLRVKADKIAADIRAIAQQNARAAMLAHVTGSMLVEKPLDAFGNPTDGVRVSFDRASTLLSELMSKFQLLPLAQRRALVRGLVDVTVTHGRGTQRIKVRHLVVTDLNEGDTDSDLNASDGE